VIARRAAQIRQHEDALRGVLADFFTAQDGAEAVRADAEAAATRVRRDAEARVGLRRARCDTRPAI
jgi:hypothetical protein